MATVADEVMEIFARRGEAAYYGEDVSQLEHALQTAFCARQEGAGESLVVAALVHDIGHLVEGGPEDIADHGIDARHEDIGQKWLEARFGKDVYEPVFLHVDAKRYLCATDPSYFGKLSQASVQSLALQGGPMSPEETRTFEQHEFYKDAIVLRTWDDKAKIPGLQTPKLEDYRKALEAKASAKITRA